MPPDSEVGPRQPLATGRIWLARAVMVQIPEDHQIMIEIVALLGQQSVSEPGAELIQCGVTEIGRAHV